MEAAKREFVNGDPRVWWLSLSGSHEMIAGPLEHGDGILRSLIPMEIAKCFFIPETETAEYLVYHASIDYLDSVLNECRYFEYYLVGEDLQWLLTETDHDVIIKAGDFGMLVAERTVGAELDK